MADGDKRVGIRCATGQSTGTGADIRIVCGFRPAVVMLHNVTGEAVLFWNKSLPDAYGWKSNGVISGTNAAENAHTHAVALDGGTSESVSGGTPAQATGCSVANASGGTPAQATPASCATSAVASKLNIGAPSFNGTGFATAGQTVTTTDNQTMPAVDTAAGMWFYCPADAASTPVLILSNTIVAGAPAVLTCQGVPAATNAGAYVIVSSAGLAAAQVVTQATYAALGDHAHGSTQATYNALAGHTHGPGNLADAASAAGSSHNHVFTGSAADNALITSLGVTPYWDGFNIGADTDVNVVAETIYWTAWRY